MYLKQNKKYWSKGYKADNIESFVWRPYHVIFDYEYGITGKKHEKLLDFGCGQGSALKFFKDKGFDVHGVDISKKDIKAAQKKMPDIKDHIKVIDPKPTLIPYFKEKYDVITAIQSLYYVDDIDWEVLQQNLYDQLKPGGIIYATMISDKCYYYKHSMPYKNGLYKLEYKNKRFTEDCYLSYIKSEQELIDKFDLFKPEHIGWYGGKFRLDEGVGHHWTLVARKEHLQQ